MRALLRLIPAGSEREAVSRLFLRREAVVALGQVQVDKQAWAQHYVRASQGLDLRRRVRTKGGGVRLLSGDSARSRQIWLKELVALWKRAERLLARGLGVSPLEVLAMDQKDGDGFRKAGDPASYMATRVGQIVTARWIRVLDPLLIAPCSSGIDPRWRSLSDDDLLEFVSLGLERERLLIQRSQFSK